jgi:Holliday junction resolvase
MGKFSRDKGKAGEREFAALCRHYGFDANRTAQCKGKTGQAGDVEGLPGTHVEVKRVEKLNLWQAMMQSVCDTQAEGKDNVPIVAHRKSRQDWLVTMLADHFLMMLQEVENARTEAPGRIETHENH